ncbi:hypothetical protein CJ217_01930 [Streptococcus sp. UMB1385]|nr:hypothetical protein CJ217_01930 [Streptococcus sp. UMB1385]
MKKLIKIDFDNTTRERKTEDSYSELYSHDKNNGSFEFEILNDTLTTEQVIALFKFTESNKIWKTTGTVEGNKVKVTFDTTLITQNETVICYLYFDEEQRTSDTFRFKFKVKVSEIDKMSRYEVKERFINNTVIVDRLDVVTKDELKEALKNVGGIATEGLLTEVKAEGLYAKKSEAVDNTNFELVKNRILALELKTDKDTVYDDSEVKERISVLEAREDNNTIYDDTSVRERLTALESKPNIDVSNLATKDELNEVRNSQPTVDTSNLVTRDELESKGYVKDLSEYAKKSELYNDSDLKTRVEVLEQKTDKDTVYDDTPLKERVTALESKAIEGGAYDDSDLRNRVVALETKEDKDTKYDDTEVKRRLTEIENKPAVDTSVFVTDQKLAEKGYLTQHQDLTPYALKSEIPQPYNDTQLNERVTALENRPTTGGSVDTSNFVTKDELATKNYLTEHQPLTEVNNRLDVLEAKQDKDTVYNDSELRERVTNLENKPNVDLTNYVTSEQLENKHYLTQHQPLDNLVTKEELNSKGYVTDEVLGSKGYLTEEVLNGKNYLTEDVLNTKNYLTQHQDLSSLVTKQELENKHFLTEHQPLTHLATTSDLEALRNISISKADLSKKVDKVDFNTFKDSVVTKTELAEGHYLTETVASETYVKKSELGTSQTNQFEIHGTGMPNGVVEAEIGTTYVDKNKTNGALKWIKTTDGGNTGWEVLIGDTGWRTLNSVSRAGNSFIKIRRVNNLVTYQFGGLQWGWFGVNRRNGPDFVRHNSSGDKGAKVLRPGGIPVGFRSESSLIGGIYSDAGKPYGIWYLGGTSDSNFIQFTFNDPIPTDKDIGDIRVSAISYLTNEPWPTQLP